MKTKRLWITLPLLVLVVALFAGSIAYAGGGGGGGGASLDVAIIGSPGVINGGTLPTTGPVGELGDFTFTNLAPVNVNAANLALYDTVVLNVASSEMSCNTGTLSAAAKADLVAFVGGGGKLIIYDSECPSQDYSWLPFPFTTSNPGAMGAYGTLTIVEENTLSSSDSTDPYYIDAPNLGSITDAVGDMNVMTTYDPNWCLDMSGTNALGTTGPVHTYAKYPSGTDVGLIIYNGLDVDYLGFEPAPPAPNGLRKIWVQELQQEFNPSNLPCGFTVVGITLTPAMATNEIVGPGTEHTVTAALTDLLGNPVPEVLVSFAVTGGPNFGEVSDPGTGECAANNDCTTDASGDVSWTYASNGGLGTDDIVACFINGAGDEVCSQLALKEWVAPPNTPPVAACVESVNPAGKKIPPAGSTTLPGSKGGRNDDGFYELGSTDAEDGTTPVFVTNVSGTAVFGPFASGSVVKITESLDEGPLSKPMGGPNSAVAAHIILDSDAFVFAVDSAGAVSPPASCLVPPPPK